LTEGTCVLPFLIFFITPSITGRHTALMRFLFFGFVASYLQNLSESHKGVLMLGKVHAFGVLLAFPMLQYCIRSWSPARRATRYAVLMILFFLGWPVLSVYDTYAAGKDPNHSLSDQLLPYVNKYAANKSFLVLEPVPFQTYPLVYNAQAHSNYPYYSIIFSGYIHQYEKMNPLPLTPRQAANFQKARAYYYDSLHHAMEYDPPALIIAMEKPVWPGFWSFPDDLLRDPVFARDWSRYVRVAEVRDDNYVAYGMYSGQLVMGIYVLQP
jgi:hypothetical protein